VLTRAAVLFCFGDYTGIMEVVATGERLMASATAGEEENAGCGVNGRQH
jgi:hypothetical protein